MKKHPLQVGDYHKRRRVVATCIRGMDGAALYRCEGEGRWRVFKEKEKER